MFGFVGGLIPIQSLKYAFAAGHGAEQNIRLFTQHDDGMKQHADKLRKQHHLAHSHVDLHDLTCAVVEDQSDTNMRDGFVKRAVQRLNPCQA